MLAFAYIAIVLWVPISCVVFLMQPARRAALWCLFVGFLCLPTLVIELPAVPDPDRNMVVGFGILFGTVLFAPARLTLLRPRWFDLPLLVLCVGPFVSSILNGLGPYDGLSAMFDATASWLPFYLVGRMYFSDAEGLLYLGRSTLLAAAVCLPFLLFEVRMSPKLHIWIYGIETSVSGDGFVRGYGIWKPVLMFPHALNTASFLAAGTLAGLWLCVTRATRPSGGVPTRYFFYAASFGLLICQVLGGWGAAVMGSVALLSLRSVRTKALILLLAISPGIWMVGRGTGTLSGQGFVDVVQMTAGDRRAESLNFRVDNETILLEKAMERPVFGWGRWGRSRVYNEDGKDLSVTDGLWIIQLGAAGLFGLLAMVAVGTLPVLIYLSRFSVAAMVRPEMAGATVMAVIVSLSLVNNVFNAFINPLALVAASGLMALRPTVGVLRTSSSERSTVFAR